MRQALLLVLFSASATAFLFGGGGGGGGGGCCCGGGGGGGGGGCCPPPPPPPVCGGCGGCGGCGRKKREATNLLTAGGKKCNNEELQTILRDNLKNDVNSSMASIREKMSKFHDYALVCDDKKLEFIVEADDYCQHQSENVFCAVFTIKNSVDTFFEEPAPAAPAVSAPLITAEKTTAVITKTIVSSNAVVVPETHAVTRLDEGKKEASKPEINKN